MKLTKIIDNYISEKDFSMYYKKNKLDIVNYSDIVDFSNTEISVKNNDKIYHIIGNNLVISKMMDNEILIAGDITAITFS